MTTPLPARRARLAAGLTLPEAARLARVTPAYLARCEREQRFAYHLAVRLHRAFAAPLETFLPWKGGGGRDTTDTRTGRRAPELPNHTPTQRAPGVTRHVRRAPTRP